MHFRPPNFEPTIYVRSVQDPYILAGAREEDDQRRGSSARGQLGSERPALGVA